MSKHSVIAAALAVIVFGASTDVQAQHGNDQSQKKPGKCFARTGREIKCKEEAAVVDAVLYPNATRAAPVFPKTNIKKEWDELVKVTNAESKDSTVIQTTAQLILEHPKASVNEKAEAAYLITQAIMMRGKNSYSSAIEFAKKAISINGLSNNSHYQLMLVLSQMQLTEKLYQESLATIVQFINETRSENAATNLVRGNALYRLGRYPEAAQILRKAFDQDRGANADLAPMLMDAYERSGQKNEAKKIAEEIIKATPTGEPGDKVAEVKQLLLLANTKQYEKAAKVFDALYARGEVLKANEYEAGYVSYSHVVGKEARAIAIINEGLAKGIIKADATVYNVLGQSYYYTSEPKAAAEAWGKAAAISPKGEYDLLLARVLAEESEYARAKTAANAALSKGIASRGEAYLIIAEAESEFGLDNKQAMLTALREAMKDPETQDRASKMMKNAGLK